MEVLICETLFMIQQAVTLHQHETLFIAALGVSRHERRDGKSARQVAQPERAWPCSFVRYAVI